jgi:hypothetical protein
MLIPTLGTCLMTPPQTRAVYATASTRHLSGFDSDQSLRFAEADCRLQFAGEAAEILRIVKLAIEYGDTQFDEHISIVPHCG